MTYLSILVLILSVPLACGLATRFHNRIRRAFLPLSAFSFSTSLLVITPVVLETTWLEPEAILMIQAVAMITPLVFGIASMAAPDLFDPVDEAMARLLSRWTSHPPRVLATAQAFWSLFLGKPRDAA